MAEYGLPQCLWNADQMTADERVTAYNKWTSETFPVEHRIKLAFILPPMPARWKMPLYWIDDMSYAKRLLKNIGMDGNGLSLGEIKMYFSLMYELSSNPVN